MASTSATLCPSHGGATTAPFLFSEDEQTPSPPPPTPCNHSLSTDETDVFLSHLLTRLSLPPPTLTPVLPLRPKQSTLVPTVISLLEPNKQLLLSAAVELGFFHVTDHGIPSHLCEAYLHNYQPDLVSDTSGLVCRESDDGGSFCMFETDAGDEFARELERVGLKVLKLLFEEKRFGITTETRSLMCVSLNKMEQDLKENKEQLHSCILRLTYERKGKKVPSAVVDDSGEWVQVKALEEAVLITVGEVAQVWSNGKFKKVRSLPQVSQSSLHQSKDPSNVLVTLLITLPEEDTLTQLMPTIQDTNISS
ncbi:2-oxoglutarate (2OG) and Fe(II)-dependent oxygenase superfamily protein [Rhynchospora pubera]|uniref:2-oxoglutarate (2OG) and Fe(II)-dependent oxygenase superfamily protein n=1 Tax=Rhynchospora pubera TaxID=906938 RepID=A0AAV8C6K0_9POAL|nr:2-oxoglutarate (2OG) and Fe(II)-dependent oxygenase superfamily protein [Rhynchospora pubera]